MKCTLGPIQPAIATTVWEASPVPLADPWGQEQDMEPRHRERVWWGILK